jgi:hypothetical protein
MTQGYDGSSYSTWAYLFIKTPSNAINRVTGTSCSWTSTERNISRERIAGGGGVVVFFIFVFTVYNFIFFLKLCVFLFFYI